MRRREVLRPRSSRMIEGVGAVRDDCLLIIAISIFERKLTAIIATLFLFLCDIIIYLNKYKIVTSPTHFAIAAPIFGHTVHCQLSAEVLIHLMKLT